jgi:nitrogen regulatory protein PII
LKKPEIIIPHRKLNDVSEILKNANTDGMSHYKIEGRGKVIPESVAIGRGTFITLQNIFLGLRLRL